LGKPEKAAVETADSDSDAPEAPVED